jgi:hypothetical protein
MLTTANEQSVSCATRPESVQLDHHIRVDRVFFVWYPSVVLGLLLALAVLAALVWTYRPPAAAREHPGDEGEATSTSG